MCHEPWPVTRRKMKRFCRTHLILTGHCATHPEKRHSTESRVFPCQSVFVSDVGLDFAKCSCQCFQVGCGPSAPGNNGPCHNRPCSLRTLASVFSSFSLELYSRQLFQALMTELTAPACLDRSALKHDRPSRLDEPAICHQYTHRSASHS